jgi:signal transduction histidine kinase
MRAKARIGALAVMNHNSGGIMSSSEKIQQNDDLAFFGKVNASISHELKNILAIISEAAGLLNDLTELAAQGKDIELDMLTSCSRDIIEEIQRGFATIKQMNTFSHSVDDLFKSVNLAEVLKLMIDLAGFLSFAGKVRFEPPPQGLPAVLTCPFRLQNLFYQALVYAFESAGPEAEIQIAMQPESDGRVRISFSGLGQKSDREFPSEQTQRIAASIGVEVRSDTDSQQVHMMVPEDAGTMK